MEDVRERLADLTLVLVAIFGFPAVLASLFRIRDIGWIPTMGLHAGIFGVVLVMVLLRRRLPVVFKSGTILILLYIVGTGSYPTMATAGSGLFFYLVTVVLAALLFGFRTGLGMIVLCFLTLLAAFIGTRAGYMAPSVDFNQYVLSTSSWASKITTFLLFSSLTLGLMTLMERRLRRSMDLMAREIEERKAAEEMLEGSLAEKDTLLREVHHRVKSNLQSVMGLLDLQASYLDETDKQSILMDSRNRIRTMALIHEELYRSDDLAEVRFDLFLERLLNNLRELYSPGSDNIALETDLEAASLVVDSAIPCGLVVNELVSNSLRHAFTDNGAGRIRITFRSDGDDRFLLSVSDNGCGLPSRPAADTPRTLGLLLIQSIAKQLDADSGFEQGEGTTFTMRFSEYREAGSVLY